jgi:NTP pyrophosphatase (non-canonical NTP hydrolase)
MQMNEYLGLSEKTEKKFSEGIVLTGEQRKALVLGFLAAKELGDFIDRIKREIIYGKKMTFSEDESDVLDRVDKDDFPEVLTPWQAELLHMILGSITEPVELGIGFFDYLIGDCELDITNLKEEAGDQLWYLAGVMRLLDTTFEEEADRNIAKLKARFGDKFSEEAALNRDLDIERNVLEDAA